MCIHAKYEASAPNLFFHEFHCKSFSWKSIRSKFCFTRKAYWMQLQCAEQCNWLQINHNIDFHQSTALNFRGAQQALV